MEATAILHKLDEILDRITRLEGATLAPSPWLSPEEAAAALGWSVTKSRQYTRRLKYCRDKGYLKSFSNQRPYSYDRQEVSRLSDQIKAGAVIIPSI